MDAQLKASIDTEHSKNNGSIGIKKPTTFQWRPTTRTATDQFTERNYENTFVSTQRMSYKSAIINSQFPSLPPKSNSSQAMQTGSLAAQANSKCSSYSKATMQHDQVAPITLTNSDNVKDLPPIGVTVATAADHIGKLTEKKTTDDGDQVWLPQMDGIDMALPSSSLATSQISSSAATSTTDHKVKMTDEMLKTEQYINFVLYGPRKSKRLPVFQEICPSSLFSDSENPHWPAFVRNSMPGEYSSFYYTTRRTLPGLGPVLK